MLTYIEMRPWAHITITAVALLAQLVPAIFMVVNFCYSPDLSATATGWSIVTSTGNGLCVLESSPVNNGTTLMPQCGAVLAPEKHCIFWPALDKAGKNIRVTECTARRPLEKSVARAIKVVSEGMKSVHRADGVWKWGFEPDKAFYVSLSFFLSTTFAIAALAFLAWACDTLYGDYIAFHAVPIDKVPYSLLSRWAAYKTMHYRFMLDACGCKDDGEREFCTACLHFWSGLGLAGYSDESNNKVGIVPLHVYRLMSAVDGNDHALWTYLDRHLEIAGENVHKMTV